MTTCDRCHAPFAHTAIDLHLAEAGLAPLPSMDPLCRSLDRLTRPYARSRVPTAEQQEGMRVQYAMAVQEAAQHTVPRATKASILALVALWVRTHDGALPLHQHFARRDRHMGVSIRALRQVFPTMMDLYRACLEDGVCSEAAVLTAANALLRRMEGIALVREHRRTIRAPG